MAKDISILTTAVINGNTVNISMGGAQYSIVIPNLSNFNISPSNPQYHFYDKHTELMQPNQLKNKDILWNNLLEEPYPTFRIASKCLDPVVNGGISDVGIGRCNALCVQRPAHCR